ncbi:hypothetical protein [Burkholderia sp. AW49-1]
MNDGEIRLCMVNARTGDAAGLGRELPIGAQAVFDDTTYAPIRDRFRPAQASTGRGRAGGRDGGDQCARHRRTLRRTGRNAHVDEQAPPSEAEAFLPMVTTPNLACFQAFTAVTLFRKMDKGI